jgi:hypothetical protein
MRSQSVPLGQVERIYVSDMGNKNNSDELRKGLLWALSKSKHFILAPSPKEADVVLEAQGELYLKGYYSLNPRSGESPANGRPIYGGSLSVELKDRSGETVWSYLATLKTGEGDAARALAKEAVKHLATTIEGKKP